MNGEAATGPTVMTPPPVLLWFKIYTGVLTGIYALCMLTSPVLFFLASRMHGDERVGAMVYAVILLAVGLPFAIACALPFFLPRKPWVWSAALLIFWIKPEVKL